MSIEGWYYLHVNGDLIYKPGADAAADIRDSDLARAMWSVDRINRLGAWSILIEGLAAGAKPERVKELASKWGCDDTDADQCAKRLGITVDRDGDMWCASGPGFVNLAESIAGFGATKLEAFADLCKSLGYQPSTMWPTSFADLLKAKVAA